MNATPLDHGCLGADYIGKPLGSVTLDVKSEGTKSLALSTVHLCWQGNPRAHRYQTAPCPCYKTSTHEYVDKGSNFLRIPQRRLKKSQPFDWWTVRERTCLNRVEIFEDNLFFLVNFLQIYERLLKILKGKI